MVPVQKGRNKSLLVPTRLAVAIFSCLVLSVLPANTAPITFTFTGTGSGSASAGTFTDSQFTIRLSADTANVVQLPDPTIFSLVGSSSSIKIDGVGAGDFLTGTRVFVNQAHNALGFSLSPDGSPHEGNDLMDIYHATFGGYDLRTSLGPITVADSEPTALRQFQNVLTSLGALSFTDAKDITFTAVTVPEPSAFALLAGAALSLIFWRWQRRTASTIRQEG